MQGNKLKFTTLDLAIADMKREGKFFSEELIWKVQTQICNFLADTEKAKLIHKKIKPSNFILFEDGRLAFEDMSDAEDVKSSAEIVDREDHTPNMQSLGSVLLSMCTGEVTNWL